MTSIQIKKLTDEIKNLYNIYSKSMQTMKRIHAELQPSQKPQKPEARSRKPKARRSQKPEAKSQSEKPKPEAKPEARSHKPEAKSQQKIKI